MGPLGGQRTTRSGERGGHIFQYPLRQDQAVGCHHHHIRIYSQHGLARCAGVFGVFAVESQTARLRHRHAVHQRKLLDAGGLQFQATPGRTVGLGQHQGDVKTRFVQLCQRRCGEFRRAGKNQPQVLSSR